MKKEKIPYKVCTETTKVRIKAFVIKGNQKAVTQHSALDYTLSNNDLGWIVWTRKNKNKWTTVTQNDENMWNEASSFNLKRKKAKINTKWRLKEKHLIKQ